MRGANHPAPALDAAACSARVKKMSLASYYFSIRPAGWLFTNLTTWRVRLR